MPEIERSILLKKPGILALFEANDPNLTRQTLGEQMLFFTEKDLQLLLNGVSTDGILPSKGGRFYKPDDLAHYALSGVVGISEDFVLNSNVGIVISGPRFGGGSAREHAPRALQGAGVQAVVVIGGPAEKIFKENCLNSGGPAVIEIPADQNLLNKLIAETRQSGKLFYQSTYKDMIRPLIAENGGLFAFNRKRISKEIEIPQISHPELLDHHMTSVQKIIARKLQNIKYGEHVIPGDVGFIRTDLRFSYEFMTRMLTDMIEQESSKVLGDALKDPSSFILFEDHLVYSGNPKFTELILNQRKVAHDFNIKLYNNLDLEKGTEGICHTLIIEKGLALPGDVVIGTDSHTCSAGTVGAFAFGVGATAMANAMLTKDTLVEVPESIKVNINGEMPFNCSAKDLMLYLLADPYVKDGGAINKVFEFSGEGLQNWTLDQLFVLCNMSVEGGATTGIVTEITDAVTSHLASVTGVSRDVIVEAFSSIQPDSNATYAREITINLNDLQPMIATPGHPSNGVPISKLEGTKITSAYIGSCTGGNLTDIREAAQILKGKKTNIPLTVQFASMQVYRQADQLGYVQDIKNAGAEVLMPGCGACIGMGPGKIANSEDVILSATNRNFPGRMGKPVLDGIEIEGGQVYLASPRVVALGSLSGFITNTSS